MLWIFSKFACYLILACFFFRRIICLVFLLCGFRWSLPRHSWHLHNDVSISKVGIRHHLATFRDFWSASYVYQKRVGNTGQSDRPVDLWLFSSYHPTCTAYMFCHLEGKVRYSGPEGQIATTSQKNKTTCQENLFSKWLEKKISKPISIVLYSSIAFPAIEL